MHRFIPRGLLGTPVRAARDFASLLASSDAIQKWATEQGSLLQKVASKDEDQEKYCRTNFLDRR